MSIFSSLANPARPDERDLRFTLTSGEECAHYRGSISNFSADLPQCAIDVMIVISMIDLNVRPAIAEGASNIARLWIQCTLEVAGLEPVYTPAIEQVKLAGRLTITQRVICSRGHRRHA